MKIVGMLLLALALPALADSPALKLVPLENHLLCIRATEVSENFSEQFLAAATNQFSGLILDLRRAGGTNKAGIADFLGAKKMPLVVLTDVQTRGAAAALAAELRTNGAVVIGCVTNATVPHAADIRVLLAAEDQRRFLENPFTNALAAGTGGLASPTNLLFSVDHTSEAELVRNRVKDGEEEDPRSPRAAVEQPVVRDPALARAMDLLKALTVLRRTRG
jgi:hypothetical protein